MFICWLFNQGDALFDYGARKVDNFEQCELLNKIVIIKILTAFLYNSPPLAQFPIPYYRQCCQFGTFLNDSNITVTS